MPSALRAWIAGLALALSVLALTLATPVEELAARAGLALFVVFTSAWIVAVGERACPFRGGLHVARFPLGPRLLSASPGMFGQLLILAMALGLLAGSWTVLGWSVVIVSVVGIHQLRSMAWYVVPALAVIQTLLNMPEFHTLGDLVADAKGWGMVLGVFLMQAFVMSGPLLRSDAGTPLAPAARVLAAVAALPGYGAAWWVFSYGPMAGRFTGLEAVVVTLLVGGALQTALLSALGRIVGFKDREASGLSRVSGRAVGRALLPLLLVPAVAGAAIVLVPALLQRLSGDFAASLLAAAEPAYAGADPISWLGLAALLLVVPGIAAAGLAGAALDRVDDEARRRGRVGVLVSLGAFGAWFALGPAALEWAYAPGGPGAALLAAAPLGGEAAIVAEAGGETRLAGLPGSGLRLYGLPAADLCRAITLMLLAASALAARAMRHARPLQLPIGSGSLGLMVAVQAAVSVLALPVLGPAGAPLAGALACGLVLLLDLRHVEILPVKPPDQAVEQLFTSDELFGAPVPMEVIR